MFLHNFQIAFIMIFEHNDLFSSHILPIQKRVYRRMLIKIFNNIVNKIRRIFAYNLLQIMVTDKCKYI